jgi:hypothetical protein
MKDTRILLALGLSALIALPGCSTSSKVLQSIGFSAAPGPISDEEAKDLSSQLMALRTQREALRIKLATEADASVRAWHYRDIASLGNEMLPLQQRLKNAGRPLP